MKYICQIYLFYTFFLKYKRSILECSFFPRSKRLHFQYFSPPLPKKKREVSGTTKQRSVGFISLSQTTRIKLDLRTAWSFEWMNWTILFFVGYARMSLISKWHVLFCFADNIACIHAQGSACSQLGYTMWTNKRDL